MENLVLATPPNHMNDSSWHDVVLGDDKLRLRPIRELDWELIYKWCNDPEVLYYSDWPGVKGYDLDTIKNSIFEAGSRSRYCFIMETEGEVIGECWLQKMNLERILEQYPSKDLRRIDLTIGEKQYWGKGNGTRAIAMLTKCDILSILMPQCWLPVSTTTTR